MKKIILLKFLLINSFCSFSQTTNNPDSVCVNSNSEIYWITPNAGSSYIWEIDPNIGVNSTNYDPITNIFTVDWFGVASGLYIDAITVTEIDSNNCEGEVTLNVRVLDLPSPPLATDVVVCENNIIPPLTANGLGNIIWYDSNGNQIHVGSVFNTPHTLPGTYTYSVSDEINGCEGPTGTVSLIINNITTGVDVQIACDSYTWIDGNTYTSSNNTATHTLTNSLGCDSVVTLDLTINNSTTGVDVQIACDSYTWIDGNTYTSSNNTATHTLTTSSGCDSVVTLNLTINNSTTGMDIQIACDSYTWIDGNTYTSSNNTATYILTNSLGCDSVVTLNLIITNTPPAPLANTVNSCENNLIDPLTATGLGVLNWFDSTGVQVFSGSPFNTGLNTPGVYTFTVFDNLNGCVSNGTQVDLIIFTAPNPGPIQHN